VSEPLEIELKLELPATAPIRLDMAGFAATAENGAASLISTYYDTPDQALRKAGYSLRVRETGGRYIQTVKAQPGASAGWYVRSEWEHDIPGARPLLDEAGPLPKIFGKHVLDEIGRAFVTEIERKVHKVRLGGATVLVADDSGEVRAGRHAEPIREVELELESGDPRLLFVLARQLGDQVPIRLGVRAKSERGYQLLDGRTSKAFKAEPIGLDPQDSAAAAFEKIVQSCIRQFRLNEGVLLKSEAPEPLHQARVGLRRLRSAFSIFAPMLAGDERAALLRTELRWIAQTLGAVRDLDVLIPRLSGSARDKVAAARAEAFKRANGEVDSARTRLLMLDLAEWLAFGDWRIKPADPSLLERDIGATARDILQTRRKKLKRNGRDLMELSDEKRHELRKQTKKLRYAAEFFASLYTKEPVRSQYRQFLEKLEKLQDELGELNDLATVPELLASLGVDDAALSKRGDDLHLLQQAHHAFLDLLDVKRFWR
jgi:triphosphatase